MDKYTTEKIEELLKNNSLIDENIPYLNKLVNDIQKKAERMIADAGKHGITPEFKKEVEGIKRIRYYIAELISRSDENARALEQCADELISCYALPFSAGTGGRKVLINVKTTPGIRMRMDRYSSEMYVGMNEVFLRALSAAASLSPDNRPELKDRNNRSIPVKFSVPDERYSLLTLYCKRMKVDLDEGVNAILDGFLPAGGISYTI